MSTAHADPVTDTERLATLEQQVACLTSAVTSLQTIAGQIIDETTKLAGNLVDARDDHRRLEDRVNGLDIGLNAVELRVGTRP